MKLEEVGRWEENEEEWNWLEVEMKEECEKTGGATETEKENKKNEQ